MIRLDVAQIKRSPGDFARYELAVDLPPITFSGEKITFAGPVKTNLTVTNTGETLTIHGSAGGKLELSCSRCLQPFDYDYMVSIDEEYSLLPTGEANEELQAFTRDYIDLTGCDQQYFSRSTDESSMHRGLSRAVLRLWG